LNTNWPCYTHYRKKDLCRASNILPSVFSDTWQRASLPSAGLCRVPFLDTRQRNSLPSAFFKTLSKEALCRVSFWDTRQRSSLPSGFFRTLGKDNFQIIFWNSKLIRIKIFSTTKLCNSSRCTIFILDISSFDKININLFTKYIYISRNLWNYKRDI
jgi:hypothetical protein